MNGTGKLDAMRTQVRIGALCLALGCESQSTPVDTDTDDEIVVPNQDLDGDGYGEDEDCNDGDAAIHPNAVETCDGTDNDCDDEVDEDVTTNYYLDLDGDGFGNPNVVVADCSQPSGYVTLSSDCDDDNGDIYPGAAEFCDEIDNDCDDEVDENLTETVYIDTDGDGYGNPDWSDEACASVSGWVADGTDCDDGDAEIHPGAEEVCDQQDNDCDDSSDEGVTTTFYADNDGDGFGDDNETTDDCAAPEGYAANSGDCDDTDESIRPYAVEICDSLDNDCDSFIDDEDTGLFDGEDWYADDDGDGFPDADDVIVACDMPSSYLAAGSDWDCDDEDGAVHPQAEETCNETDDDCDGLIDDDDTLADGAGETYYLDYDADGLGGADFTVETCDPPSGYVQNNDDCDDTDATDNVDSDGDGDLDCIDIDDDDDGLRDEWDADALDETVIRGPNAGLGTLGAWTVSVDETIGSWSAVTSEISLGDSAIYVDDDTIFQEGDEVLLWSPQGDGAGLQQLVFVAATSTGTLTIEPPVNVEFDSGSETVAVHVPHYTTVTIEEDATLWADPWSTAGLGLVAFRATDSIDILGTIDASGAGFGGGPSVSGNVDEPDQGESHGGTGTAGEPTANGGGGGAYPARPFNADCGGGGGFGTDGEAGTKVDGSDVTDGGGEYGDTSFSDWHLGSGGGAGSPDTSSGGDDTGNITGSGGDGGGLIALFAGESIEITGIVACDGSDGGDATASGGSLGGGGGGSGGRLVLSAPEVTISGVATALGGAGGASADTVSAPAGDAHGGDGGDGRVLIQSDDIDGESTPAASEEAWVE